ncbi:MAG TPA: hypothetical protein VLJ42_12195 [Solirubrobacteraceae bacterium]|nr:hypothetical protein [Solirubrobacteraceae bacterium]
MATASTNSPSGSTARKPAAKRAAAKPTARRTPASTQSKSTRAKSARTRAAHQTEDALRQSEAALRSTQTAAQRTAGVVGEYAERAVLIPVGAALIARDRIVSNVSDTITNYSSTTKAQTQLRKFEHRGSTARNRLEREVRKTRTRVERELRQRRNELEQQVTSLDKRRETLTKDSSEFVGRIQERVLSLV